MKTQTPFDETHAFAKQAARMAIRERTHNAEPSPNTVDDHLDTLHAAINTPEGRKALGVEPVAKYMELLKTFPERLKNDNRAPIHELAKVMGPLIRTANRILVKRGRAEPFESHYEPPGQLPPTRGKTHERPEETPADPRAAREAALAAMPIALGKAKGELADRWKLIQGLMEMGHDHKTVVDILQHTFQMPRANAAATVRRIARANAAPKKLKRTPVSSDHDALVAAVHRSRGDATSLAALGDNLADAEHRNAPLLQAAAVRSPHSALSDSPPGTRHSMSVWEDDVGGTQLGTGGERHAERNYNHQYMMERHPDGTVHVATSHYSLGNPALDVRTPVHSLADLHSLTHTLPDGVRAHLWQQGAILGLPENHETAPVRLERDVRQVLAVVNRTAMGTRNWKNPHDPAHDQLASAFGHDDIRGDVIRHRVDGSVPAALQKKANVADGIPQPLETVFRNPSAQTVRTMEHPGGGTTVVTRHAGEHIGSPLYHAKTTLPNGQTYHAVFSHGEYAAMLQKHTPAPLRQPGMTAAHPLRFAAKLSPVSRGDLRKGGVDSAIKDTALHYHLKQIEQQYKEEQPTVSALATHALKGTPAAIEALGKQLAKRRHPLAAQYNWDRIGDSLKTDGMLDSWLNTNVKRDAHETDAAFMNRVHDHLSEAANGSGTQGAKKLLGLLEAHVAGHTYLSKHVGERQRLLDSVHRIADRHSEREHLSAATSKEPSLAGKAKRVDEWLEKTLPNRGMSALDHRQWVKRLLTATEEQMAAMNDTQRKAVSKLRASMATEFGTLPDARAALDSAIAFHKAKTVPSRSAGPVSAKTVDSHVTATTSPQTAHMKFKRTV